MEEQKGRMTKEQVNQLMSLFLQLEWVLYAGDGEEMAATLGMFRPIAQALVDFPKLEGEQPTFDAKKAAESHPNVLPFTHPDKEFVRKICSQCHL